MGARNQVGIGLSYRPARLHRLAEMILGIDSCALQKFKNSGSAVYHTKATFQLLLTTCNSSQWVKVQHPDTKTHFDTQSFQLKTIFLIISKFFSNIKRPDFTADDHSRRIFFFLLYGKMFSTGTVQCIVKIEPIT